ncbi:MAG: M56 family metallopeptidase [Balneolaceae bacterium]
MKALYEFFQNIGMVSLDTLWFPMIIWTVVALLAFIGLKVSRNLNPLYHYHLRTAIIAAIPFGLVSSFLIQLLVSNSSTSSSFEPVFFVIESPIAQAFNSSVTSTSFTPDWFEPHFLLGAITTALLFISVLMLFRLFWTYFNLKKLHKSLTKIELTNIPAFENTDSKRIKLSYHDHPLVPFTFGWKQPIIVLPNSIKDDPKKVQMAIQHEMVHIRRGDYLLQLFLSSIQSILWFHPLIWFGSKEIETYREISCDQEVLSTKGISVKSYASMLYELVPLQKGIGSFSISMAVQKSTLKQRIEIMKYHKLHKNSFKRSMLFLAVMIIAITIPIACSDMQHSSYVELEELETATLGLDNATMTINGLEQDVIPGMSSTGVAAFFINAGDFGVFKIAPRKFEGGVPSGKIIGNTVDFTINELKVMITSKNNILSSVQEAEVWVEHYPNKYSGFSHGITSADESLSDYLSTYEQSDLSTDKDDLFIVVEEMPKLIGGLQSLQSKIEYPEEAKKMGIEGRVILTFIVDEDGNVENPMIVRGIGGGADEEALRAVKEVKFTPGIQRGRPVRVKHTLPVIFRLTDSDF